MKKVLINCESAVKRFLVFFAWRGGAFFREAAVIGSVMGLLVFFVSVFCINLDMHLDMMRGPIGWLGMISPIVLAAVIVFFSVRGRGRQMPQR